MEQQFLDYCRGELVNGHVKRGHPFRYFTLSTISDEKPRQRTVVLRKLLPDFNVLFYTDARSQKVQDIAKNPNVSALFYHPKKLMQVKLEGKAKLITDTEELNSYWKAIPESSRKDYITRLAPSTNLANPDHVEYEEEQPHFAAIKIIPETMEYLQLKRPNHMRILYTKQAEEWKGQFLVP
jgi:pyridoxine/pyridoxamine 5'-phosphate oxidase